MKADAATKNWKDFEQLIAAVTAAENKGAVVRWNERIGGRQFDVTIRFRHNFAEYLTVVECKAGNDPVKAETVDALVTKGRDAKADKAILASTAGFQKGALEVAERHSVVLLSVKEKHPISDDVLGPPIEVFNISQVLLIYSDGRRVTLPSEPNALTYYVRRTGLLTNEGTWTLADLMNRYQLRLRAQPNASGRCAVPCPSGNRLDTDPDSDIPAGELIALEFEYSFTTANTLKQEPCLDLTILQPMIEVTEVLSGRQTLVDHDPLKQRSDKLTPGRFYEGTGLSGFYYYCDSTQDSTVRLIAAKII